MIKQAMNCERYRNDECECNYLKECIHNKPQIRYIDPIRLEDRLPENMTIEYLTKEEIRERYGDEIAHKLNQHLNNK